MFSKEDNRRPEATELRTASLFANVRASLLLSRELMHPKSKLEYWSV
jgi:hypothetical protein